MNVNRKQVFWGKWFRELIYKISVNYNRTRVIIPQCQWMASIHIKVSMGPVLDGTYPCHINGGYSIS